MQFSDIRAGHWWVYHHDLLEFSTATTCPGPEHTPNYCSLHEYAYLTWYRNGIGKFQNEANRGDIPNVFVTREDAERHCYDY